MQSTLENLPGLERKLNVTIPAERVEELLKKRLEEIAEKAKVPGFRPGKVPFDMIQKQYGKSAYSQVLQDLIRETYPQVIQKENLKPVVPPEIQIDSAKSNEDFLYSALFEVYPEIKLEDLEKIEVEKIGSNVESSDLDEMLEKMRKSHATWEEIEDESRKSQEGDQLTLDFTVQPQDSEVESKTEKGVKFTLGDGYMWSDFEKPLYNVVPGEEKEYTLDMPPSHLDKNLAGKKVDFKVKVHKISSPILPELNDEFAAKMSIKEGGLEKLKDEVRTQMERELDQVLTSLFKQTIMEKLLDHHTIEVPKVLVEEELKRIAENWQKGLAAKGITPDKIPAFPRDEFISQAERNVALGLLFAHVVKEGKITVSQAEVRKKIEDLMSNYYEDKEEMINKCLADSSYVQEMKTLLLEEKVVEYLSAQMIILDKIISYKEAMEKR